eukprot:TRINITY_DN8807_c0_g1_i1.p1 TRINITY_DN8807_c0_g1~~TRINITY_DN8807_c0_g1_i1.p1  ORF type:complete len:282 (-),score=71.04 TRINITY_DN8807_c0_g1_i1:206-1024(-)
MKFLLIALIAVCAVSANAWFFEPGYPQSFYFPAYLDTNLGVSTGHAVAYQVNNIAGSFQFNYWVSNQPNRHAKFQVLVLNAANFHNFTNGYSYQCINYAQNQCQQGGTATKSGNFNGNLQFPESLFLVVLNLNFASTANIRVNFNVVGPGGPGPRPGPFGRIHQLSENVEENVEEVYTGVEQHGFLKKIGKGIKKAVGGSKCAICKTAVDVIKAEYGGKISNIPGIINRACGNVPVASELCRTFIGSKANQIGDLLNSGDSSSQVCSIIKAC